MKLYFQHIDITDYMLYLLYNVGFMLLLGIIFRLFGPKDRSSQLLSVIIFQLYFAVLMLDSVFEFLPYMPDTDLFSNLIANHALQSDAPLGVTSFYYLSFIISLFCLADPVIFIISQIFLFVISLLLFARAWAIYSDGEHAQAQRVVFLVLSILLPSGLLYVTAPLRDTLIIFGFAVFLNGLAWFIKKGANWNLVWGNIILYLFRPQLLFYAVIGLSIKPFEAGKNRVRKALVMLSVAVVGLFGVTTVLNYQINPEWLSNVRNKRIDNIDGDTDTYGQVNWSSFADVAIDVPALSLQFILSPLPIVAKINPIDKFTIFLDSLFVLCICLVILIYLGTVFKKYPAWILLIVVYILLLGIYEYHLTGAVRHRFPVVLMMMCLAAQLIANQLLNLKRLKAS